MAQCCFFREWEVLPYEFSGEARPCDVFAVVNGLGLCCFCWVPGACMEVRREYWLCLLVVGA